MPPTDDQHSDDPAIAPETSPSEDVLLETRKNRVELRKLELEVQELKSWRAKFVLSSVVTVIAPLGSVLLFLAGWYGSHASERVHQNQELYTRAAKELSSSDASVRLSGVKTLDRFVRLATTGAFATLSDWLFTSQSAKDAASERAGETMALLIGSLSRESDPAVLDAIAQDVLDNPQESVVPLISTNKTAAVLFARAAGEYSGLSALRLKRARSFSEDDWRHITGDGFDDPTIDDIVVVVLRTGSPFEATEELNQRFSARDFLTSRKCPFHDLFYRQAILTMGSGLNDVTRRRPPTPKEVEASIARVVGAAAVLERSSHILAKLADKKWDVLKDQSLFGTAVVVGEVNPETIKNLRSRGAYFTSPGSDTNHGCTVLP